MHKFQIPGNKMSFGAAKPGEKGVIVLPVFSDQKPSAMARHLGKGAEKIIKAQMDAGVFRGSSQEILPLVTDGFILAGLGKKAAFHPDRMAALIRTLAPRLLKLEASAFHLKLTDDVAEALEAVREGRADSDESEDSTEEEDSPDYLVHLTMSDLVEQCVVSLLVGSDAMEILKKERPRKKKAVPKITFEAAGLSREKTELAVRHGETTGTLLNRFRYTASLPGNHFHPAHVEDYARDLAKEHKLQIQVFHETQLEKLGCGGILAVGRGSEIPPRMIVLHYRPTGKSRRKKPLVLVGKGITFATGGISLKPPAEMHEMKYDMCGAALVLHALALAAKLKLPIEVVGLVGVAENMPDGRAIKPGDVYTAYNGVTVEVQNTDAEGRLVLGDVLSYAQEKYKPETMLDFATLTGAVIIALGHEAAAAMTQSEDLAARIDKASRSSLDRTWRMPHWFQYAVGFKSDVADLRNIAGREAGTVTAMKFLSRFVKPGVDWAHIDIAGMAWRGKASGGQCRGATGWGLRFLQKFMIDHAGGH